MVTLNILGSNLACLLLAEKYSASGQPVYWMLDGGTAGSHFAGLDLDGEAFNFGMVQIEQPGGHLASTQDIKDFKPTIYRDWLNYSALINREIEELFNPIQTQSPSMILGGESHPDFLVSNYLDCLRSNFLANALDSDEDDQRNAKFKGSGEAFESLDYETASLFNHGPDIHSRIIKPFFSKLSSVPCRRIFAKHHRSIWLPLYWQDTIIQQLVSGSSSLEPYRFLVPKNGTIASIIRGLTKKVVSRKNVRCFSNAINSFYIKNGQPFVKTKLDDNSRRVDVIGVNEKRMSELLGRDPVQMSDFASIEFSYFDIATKLLSNDYPPFINVVDSEHSIFRVSFQKNQSNMDITTLIVESRPDLESAFNNNNDRLSHLAMQLAKIVDCDPFDLRSRKIINALNILPLPTFDNIALYNKRIEEIRAKLPDVHLTGSLLGFGFGSMNEQIAQALRISSIQSH